MGGMFSGNVFVFDINSGKEIQAIPGFPKKSIPVPIPVAIT